MSTPSVGSACVPARPKLSRSHLRPDVDRTSVLCLVRRRERRGALEDVSLLEHVERPRKRGPVCVVPARGAFPQRTLVPVRRGIGRAASGTCLSSSLFGLACPCRIAVPHPPRLNVFWTLRWRPPAAKIMNQCDRLHRHPRARAAAAAQLLRCSRALARSLLCLPRARCSASPALAALPPPRSMRAGERHGGAERSELGMRCRRQLGRGSRYTLYSCIYMRRVLYT